MTNATIAWLKSTKLTPLQLIYVFGALFSFIFMATDIFNALPDFAKVLFYGGTVLIGVLLGVSIFNIKQIAADMKKIFVDKNMTAEQKVNAFGNLALQVLYKLGEAWEEFQNVQFDDARQTEIDTLKSEIAELESKLAEK